MAKKTILILLVFILLIFSLKFAWADMQTLEEIKKLEYSRLFDAEKFKSFLSHPDEKIRTAAIIACGRIGDCLAIDLLDLRLCKETKINQAVILFMLGQFKNSKSIPYIMPFINNPDKGLRILSIEALGKIQDPELSPVLLEKLKDKDPKVRSATAIALGRMQNGYAVPFLMQFLYEEENKLTKGDAAWSLQRYLPQWREYPAAKYSMTDNNGWVRLNSLKLLEKATPYEEDYLTGIEAKLIDEYWPVQAETIKFLKMQNDNLYVVPIHSRGVKNDKELENYLNLTHNPVVIIEMNKGKIALELFENTAPFTVYNFIKLVNNGFYDGLTFHRVIPGFVVQGGCPKGDGTGGPHYIIPCEINMEEHTRGTLSMAHAGKDTGGSQFFICHTDQPHLDGIHTIFGKVLFNQELVDQIKPDDKIIKIYLYKK